jgi:hypothetical protein
MMLSPRFCRVRGALRARSPRQPKKGWPLDDRGGPDNPLRWLEDWEDFVEGRYPVPGQKAQEDYRNYDNPARDNWLAKAEKGQPFG